MQTMSDQGLQARLLELAEAGTLLYARGSGANKPPEHFLQNYCAAKLIEDGWLVTSETCARDYKEWFELPQLDPELARFFIDLLVYDPPADGIADHAPLRAIVEFKTSPWKIGNDCTKIARLLALLRGTPRANAFGYIVAAGEVYARPQVLEDEIASAEAFVRPGCGPMTPPRRFSVPVKKVEGNVQHHGVVIGLPVGPMP